MFDLGERIGGGGGGGILQFCSLVQFSHQNELELTHRKNELKEIKNSFFKVNWTKECDWVWSVNKVKLTKENIRTLDGRYITENCLS